MDSDLVAGLVREMKPDCYCIGGDEPHYTKRQLDTAVAAACEQLRADLDEQCRLLGMSGEREAKHLAQIERLTRFVEEARRSGDTRLASMAIAVLNGANADASFFPPFTHGGVVEWPDVLPEPPKRKDGTCRRCGGTLRPGQAIEQTWKPGIDARMGDTRGATMIAGGPGKLVPCLKCERCGWSVTGGMQK